MEDYRLDDEGERNDHQMIRSLVGSMVKKLAGSMIKKHEKLLLSRTMTSRGEVVTKHVINTHSFKQATCASCN